MALCSFSFLKSSIAARACACAVAGDSFQMQSKAEMSFLAVLSYCASRLNPVSIPSLDSVVQVHTYTDCFFQGSWRHRFNVGRFLDIATG